MTELANSVYKLAESAFGKAEQAGRTQPAPLNARPNKARKVKEKYRFEQTEPALARLSPRPTAPPTAFRLIRRTSLKNPQERPVYTVQPEDQPRIIIEAERVLGFTALSSSNPEELSLEEVAKIKSSLEEVERTFTK